MWAVGSRSGRSNWIGPRSNRDRWAQIGGLWEFGRAGRRRYDAGELFRGGARRTSPDFAVLGAPGSNSTGSSSHGDVRGMHNTPRASTWRCRERSGVRCCRGGPAAVVVPACARPHGAEGLSAAPKRQCALASHGTLTGGVCTGRGAGERDTPWRRGSCVRRRHASVGALATGVGYRLREPA